MNVPGKALAVATAVVALALAGIGCSVHRPPTSASP